MFVKNGNKILLLVLSFAKVSVYFLNFTRGKDERMVCNKDSYFLQKKVNIDLYIFAISL